LCILLGTAVVPSAHGQDETEPVYDPALYDAMEYRMIGPYRGGRVTAVTGVPGKEDAFMMGSTGGGVWETTDAGESWTNVTDGQLRAGSIGAVNIAPSDPSVVYVGTGSACPRGNVSIGKGMYRSTDGGDTWEHVGIENGGLIGRIAIHPDDADRVYAAVLGNIFGSNPERGVYRSTDGGDTWERVLHISDSTGVVDLAMNPENPDEIYAAAWTAERKPWTLVDGSAESGLYKTTNGGETWKELGGGLPDGIVGRIGVSVSPVNPERVWALVTAEDPDGGLYRSDDGGETWKRINRNHSLRQRGWYYSHVHADPQDENTVYVLNTGMYRSTDGGEDFKQIDVPHGDVHDLWIRPSDPETMVVGNDGGAQVSQNGGETWTTMHNQPTAEFYRVEVDNQFPYRVYGAQQDNSTISVPSRPTGSITPEQEWYAVGGGESGHIAVHPEDPNIVYAGSYSGEITYLNRDTGHRRQVTAYPHYTEGTEMRNLKYRFQWNFPIEISSYDHDKVYITSQYVMRSTNEGQSWEAISPDLTTGSDKGIPGGPVQYDATGVEVYNSLFSFKESPHEEGVLWAGTDDGLVHLTRDEGETWTEITPEGIPEGGTVNTLEVSPHNPGRAYLSVYKYREGDFSPYVFRTDDYGSSWERIADGTRGIPADHFVRVVREDPNREGLLYAGTEFGMYVSFDDGEHWQSLQLNLPTTPITDLRVHEKDLVVATQGRSFWILDDLTPLHEITEEVADSEVHLYQPRPAYRVESGGYRSEARAPEPPPEGALFSYYFAEKPEEEVSLEIRDGEGTLVRRFSTDPDTTDLVRERKLKAEAGMNRITWDLTYPGPDLVEDAVMSLSNTGGLPAPPDTYHARLSAGDRSTEKTVEVRMDPRETGVSVADLRAQFELALRTRDRLNEIHQAIRTIRTTRNQLDQALDPLESVQMDETVADSVRTVADQIKTDLTEIEDMLIQTENESPQDPINYPPQLDNQWAYLYTHINGAYARPSDGTYKRFADLVDETDPILDRLQSLLSQEVGSLNDWLFEQEIPYIRLSFE